MAYIKLDKRCEEELAGIRKIAEKYLPKGKALAVINKCNRITIHARKATAALERGQVQHANYDARTQEDIAAQYNAQKAVFAALLGGRKISLMDALEFRTAEMHTTIHYIRREIQDKNLPYELCDEWFRPMPDRRPFKRYWIVRKEDEK